MKLTFKLSLKVLNGEQNSYNHNYIVILFIKLNDADNYEMHVHTNNSRTVNFMQVKNSKFYAVFMCVPSLYPILFKCWCTIKSPGPTAKEH